MNNSQIGQLAGLLSMIGFIPYIIGILKRRVIPNRVTWTIWTLIGTVLLISYISVSNGVNASTWVPVGYVLGPGIIMILSFYYGEGGYSRLDLTSFALSILSILLWIITKNPAIALCANITADALAAAPTIYKTYYQPETESFTAWTFFLIGNTINLFVIPEVTFETFIYPFYLFIVALIIFILVLGMKLVNLGSVKSDKV